MKHIIEAGMIVIPIIAFLEAHNTLFAQLTTIVAGIYWLIKLIQELYKIFISLKVKWISRKQN